MWTSNFIWLEEKWPNLSELGQLAEENLYTDPNTTLIKLRMFGEQVVDYIFSVAEIEEPEDPRQFARLKTLEKKELVEEEILKLLHEMRKKGNKAVHDSAGSLEEAKELLKAVYKIAIWLQYIYGSNDDWEPSKFEFPPEEIVTNLAADRKFITTDPLGISDQQAEQEVWAAVKKAFRAQECLAYWRYPIFSQRGEDRKEPDILIVDRKLGLVVMEVNKVTTDQLMGIDGDTWQYESLDRDYGTPVEEAEDQLFALLGYCNSERKLRRKVTGRSIVVLPNITQQEWAESNLPKPEEVGEVIFSDQLGEQALLEEIAVCSPVAPGNELDNQQWKMLISVLTGTVLYREQDKQNNKDKQTRQGVKKTIKEQLHEIDLKQEEIGKTIPPGPQRIRGIAGSGKSVLLCQKAAQMYLKNPDWKIALVFFTRSLYDATINQLDKWLRRFSNGQQGYDPLENDNLQVLHAWGSRGQAGFYRELCRRHGMRPLTAGSDKLTAEKPNQKLIQAVKLMLEQADEIQSIYDAVLIDEAQDLVTDNENLKYKDKQPFFWLAYQALKTISENNQKRLIWAYDEAQSLNSLNIPTAPELFGDDPQFKRIVSGLHQGGIRKSEVMYKCYRTPGPILVAAHAIGMGLLREEGMLRGFTTQSDWEDIGYEVQEGSFRPGNKIVLHRSEETTPNQVPEIWPGSVIDFTTYQSRQAELEALAENINQNIKQEGLEPSRDILVIALGRYQGFKLKQKAAQFLKEQGINIYIPKAVEKNKVYFDYPNIAPNKFWHEEAVTVTNIYRAKGNEAHLVYVIGLDEVAKNESDIGLRNQLFVALTRAKGWVTISGIGDYDFYEEVQQVIDSGNTFEFEFQRPAIEK